MLTRDDKVKAILSELDANYAIQLTARMHALHMNAEGGLDMCPDCTEHLIHAHEDCAKLWRDLRDAAKEPEDEQRGG